MSDEIELWKWEYVDEHGKKRVTRYLLTADDARRRLGESAKPLAGSREVARQLGNTSDFLKRS